jgi:hypothetical protein
LSEVAPSVGGGAPTGRHKIGDSDSGTEAIATQVIRKIIRAAGELDPAGVQAQLDTGTAKLSLASCIDRILLPAVGQLQLLRLTGQHDAEQDLLAGEAVRAWLSRRSSFAPPPLDIGPILLACGPRDRQTVVVECLALLLRIRRRPCRLLGARTSIFTLTVAAQAADAMGVVVISMESRARSVAGEALRAVDALGIPVYYAGKSFDSEHNRYDLPGRYLGTQMADACTVLATTLQDRPT